MHYFMRVIIFYVSKNWNMHQYPSCLRTQMRAQIDFPLLCHAAKICLCAQANIPQATSWKFEVLKLHINNFFVQSLVCSFDCLFTRSFICLLVFSFICYFVHLFVLAFFCSYIRFSCHSFKRFCLFILTDSFICSFILSFINLFFL